MTTRQVSAPPPEGGVTPVLDEAVSTQAVSTGDASAADQGSALAAPGEGVASAAGGLQLLGSADAVVCEGDVCWVPATDG